MQDGDGGTQNHIMNADEKIKKYFELLQKWNAKMNLMSVADEAEFYDKHVADVKHILKPLEGCKRIVDLGSGGGVPGILVKIMRPDIELTMVDASRKKVSFCGEVCRSLNLKDIFVIWGRAEDEGLMRGLGAFDAVISRATWSLSDYVVIGANYIDVGGRCIAMKGSRWAHELAAAKGRFSGFGLALFSVDEYELRGGEKRAIVTLKKEALLQS